jgi:hypothetical protein
MPETAPTGDANVAESILAVLSADDKAGNGKEEEKTADEPEAEAPPADDEPADTEAKAEAADTDAASGEEPDAEAEAESAQESEEPDPSTEVEVNGERITLEELKRGYMRQQDYTRKTQALAPERQALETERKQTKEFLNQVLSFVHMIDPLRQYREIDWDKLSAEDPNVYTRLRHQYERDAQYLRHLEAAHAAAGEKAFADYTRHQRDAIVAAIPELTDASKRDAILKEMSDAMLAVGFTPDDVRRTVDHRVMLLARDAAYGQKMREAAKTAKDKAVKQPPKTVAPKGEKERTRERSLREKQALTRNWRAARSDREKADAILRML